MAATTEVSEHQEHAVGRVQVWDRFSRFSHWTVALCFFLAYFSEDELLTLHVWAGYVIGVLVVARIAWGFVGPRHARFSDFVCAPWTAWRYFLALLRFRAERHVGHSPAGGVMVLLLLAGLLVTVWSGMELHAAENGAGPLASVASPDGVSGRALSVVNGFLPAARADGREEREERHDAGRGVGGADDDVWEEIHEVMANSVMVLVVLHVLGVVLASVVHRENLVRAMFTGSKRSA